jgi:hypothetical protein
MMDKNKAKLGRHKRPNLHYIFKNVRGNKRLKNKSNIIL